MRVDGHRLLRFWLATLVCAITCARMAPADDAPGSGPAPLTMMAETIRYWDHAEARWIWLRGQAAASQAELKSPVAEQILARIRSRSTDTGRVAKVELFVVNNALDGLVLDPSPVAAFETDQRVLLRARTSEGVIGLSRMPPEFGAALARLESTEKPREPKPPSDQIKPIAPGETKTRPHSLLEPPGPAEVARVMRHEPNNLDLLPQVKKDEQPPLRDPEVAPSQDLGDDGPDFVPPLAPSNRDEQDDGGMPLERPQQPPTDVLPLPRSSTPNGRATPPARVRPSAPAPIAAESRRIWSISPRYAGRPLQIDHVPREDGMVAIVVRGGIIMICEDHEHGRVDLAADHVVIWTRTAASGEAATLPDPSAGPIEQDAQIPLEVYLEGDVVIRNDRLQVAGPNDQTTFKAKQAYYDHRTSRVLALDAEFDVFAPGLIAPMRTQGQLISQYRPSVRGPDGRVRPGPAQINVDRTMTTGSRFPKPGYRFNSNTVDIFEVDEPLTDPATGGLVGPAHDPAALKEKNWLIDARQNIYYIGPVPVFFWPRILTTTDDLDPPLRGFSFRYGTYFGYQVLSDWNGFKLFNLRRPNWIGNWNVDTDYLSLRGPALGTNVDWFGRDILGDIQDPYGERRLTRDVDQPYNGYFHVWGILDSHNDVLGSGPAVVTYGPPGAGKKGYQRINVPSFQDARGNFTFRHMQSLLGPDAEDDDDLRLQLEAAGYSDRHFLEQYYKRLFDTGLDQDTLAYLNWQRRNTALTLTGQVNFMNWITDTQWLPKLEYYRIADKPFGGLLTHSQNWGIDYANVHTAVEVNNPNIFAFMPFDPISNTSGPFSTGRGWTTQELEMPLQLGFLKFTPYVQGQLMGWNNQLDYQPTGRAWGAYGARLGFMAWKVFSDVEDELLNVHGLAHKAAFRLDYRNAYTTLDLNRIGVQDVLDDDTYEFTRRYFALTNYVGGLLPPQYDPRLLILRRTFNPVVFSPDIQSNLQTFTVGINQRLQTKRGPEGRRRIVDWMVLDAQTTFFPQSSRDNFGEPIGQTMYDYAWFLGDRTSIISTGWFEFWNIQSNPILVTEPRKSNDPFGLNVITAGLSINRPPRGNIYLGYSIINTGPIATSALNAAFNYWLSPKWYASFASSYDFGNAILLGSTVSITKIGADFLTSIGLSVDPQRQNYTFGLEIAPRFSPSMKFGSAVGTRFDSRFAPTQ